MTLSKSKLASCLAFVSALVLTGCSATRPLTRVDPATAALAVAAPPLPSPDAVSEAPASAKNARPERDSSSGGSTPPAVRRGLVGVASFYHPALNGRPTASGEVYDDQKLTAASRTLGLGTRVRVVNLDNRKSVVLTVNDRGPYVSGRIIDVSRRAARVLGFLDEGLTRVRVVPL